MNILIKQIKQIFIIYSLRGFQIYEKEMTSTHAPNLNKQHLNTGLCSNQTHQFTVKAHHKCTQETKLVKSQREKKWPTIHVDDQLNWSKHVNNVKKGFFNNLNLLKQSRFPPKIMLLYLKGWMQNRLMSNFRPFFDFSQICQKFCM